MVAYVYRLARRIVITVVGTTLLLIGIAMIVLPGPAVVVIPMGLAVLGLEFAFARRWLAQVKEHGMRALRFWDRSRAPQPPAVPERDRSPSPYKPTP